jgi:DNA-binding transcriptional LysR family regulator
VDSINQLRYIVALAQEGNFRRAAAKIGISHSALSSSVARIEEKYGTAIFVRTRTRTQPTAFGKLLLRAADLAISAIENAESEISQLLRMEAGSIVIGVCPSISSGPLMVALVSMFGEIPGASYRIVQRTWRGIDELLREGFLDFYVGFAPEFFAPDLEYETFKLDGALIVCRADHPISRKAEVTRADLMSYPLAFSDAPDGCNQEIQAAINGWLEGSPALRAPFLLSQDPHLVAAFVCNTNAIGFVPRHVAAPMILSAHLEQLNVIDLLVAKKFKYVVVRRESRFESPIAAAFIRNLKIGLANY